jgi:hypothetical protein
VARVTLRDAMRELRSLVRTGFGKVQISFQEGEVVGIDATTDSYRQRDLSLLLDREVHPEQEATPTSL